MKKNHLPADIQQFLTIDTPDEIWSKAVDIVRHINPQFDFSLTHVVFVDVLRMFNGEYPGYCAIKTPYHNLHHTLDVFLCSVRLMHGVHVGVSPINDQEITLIMMATLLHDIGYAQREGEETGTGAQFTLTHVDRGIEFMRGYLPSNGFPEEFFVPLECMMSCTNPALDFASFPFPTPRIRLLSQLVGSADIVGQMADRTYLEKLMFLYLEFKEARFGGYESIYDLLHKTRDFYQMSKARKLEGNFEDMYKNLRFHFQTYWGVDRNLYLESIEKNIEYLAKVIALNEAEYLSMLKRGGIAEKAQKLAQEA